MTSAPPKARAYVRGCACTFGRLDGWPAVPFLVWALLSSTWARADATNRPLDTIGVTLLRTFATNLDGTGISVCQVEAESPPLLWEVNPTAVGLPITNFTWYSMNFPSGTNWFPNSGGSESSHADAVGALFYGWPGGVLTNTALVDNYEANFFYSNVLLAQTAINDRVVNQSFVHYGVSVVTQQGYDSYYDTYADQGNTLFISAVGYATNVSPPSTCYNGIAVGAFGGNSSAGPTPDNGRAKPDLTAPAAATSYSTPLVAGAAALLLQAGLLGYGGSDINAAVDLRTLKALLLNGAIKPADWANPWPSPLDPRYGAGVLNVFNSYNELTGGKQPFIASTSIAAGGAHPPTNAPAVIDALQGWDFNTISTTISTDGVNHYYFNLASGTGNATFTCTATLAWNRQAGEYDINNLDLYLYDVSSGSLMGASTSQVDNAWRFGCQRQRNLRPCL
jgi:Subtilase family